MVLIWDQKDKVLFFDSATSPNAFPSGICSGRAMGRRYLRTLSGRGSDRGQFQIQDHRPRDVAMQIVAGIQGALLMGRLTGDAFLRIGVEVSGQIE